MWLAPNMVTLLGFFFIIGNVLLICIEMPDLQGPVRVPTARQGRTHANPGL